MTSTIASTTALDAYHSKIRHLARIDGHPSAKCPLSSGFVGNFRSETDAATTMTDVFGYWVEVSIAREGRNHHGGRVVERGDESGGAGFSLARCPVVEKPSRTLLRARGPHRCSLAGSAAEAD